MKNDLSKALYNIDKIYDALQSNRSEEAWDYLVTLIDLLQLILSSSDYEEAVDIEVVNGILSSIVVTMETKDTFMLADLLSYELKPILEALLD